MYNKYESKKIDFVVLVIAKDNRQYNFLKKIMNATWVKNHPQVFYIYGNGKLGAGEIDVRKLRNLPKGDSDVNIRVCPTSTDGKNNLTCDSVQGWDEILPNTISAMKYIQDNLNFDYLIRTNQSTYWNLQNLSELLRSLPETNLYAGFVDSKLPMQFVSGSGVIMSKDVVNLLTKNPEKLESRLIDDLAIGKFLNSMGIKPFHLIRPQVLIAGRKLRFLVQNGESQKFVRFFFGDEIVKAASIRCKSEVLIKNVFGNQKLKILLRLDLITILAVHLYIKFKTIGLLRRF